MDPEEFKKKYGFDPFGSKRQDVSPAVIPAAPVIPPADPVIPVDPRTFFPGGQPSAPTAAPGAPVPAGPPVSPFVSGTDPVAQETQAAFYEKFGFPMFTPNFFPSDPSAQPVFPSDRQVPGGPVRALGAEPTPRARPTEAEWEGPADTSSPLPSYEMGIQGLAAPVEALLDPRDWLSRLHQGVKAIDLFDTSVVFGGGPQQAWASPEAQMARGLSASGEEQYQRTREAVIEATPLGRWLDGRYGDVNDGDAFGQMIQDMSQFTEEQPIGYSIAAGFATPANLLPVPILDDAFRLAFTGVYKGAQLTPGVRRGLLWLTRNRNPVIEINSANVTDMGGVLRDQGPPPVDRTKPFFYFVTMNGDGSGVGVQAVPDTPETRVVYERLQEQGQGRIGGPNETVNEVVTTGGYRAAVEREVEGIPALPEAAPEAAPVVEGPPITEEAPARTVNELLSDIEANKGFMEAKDARPGHAPVNYASDINKLDDIELDIFYRRIAGDPTIPGSKADESSQFVSDVFGAIVENSYKRRGISPPAAAPDWRFPPGRSSFVSGTPAVLPQGPVARSNARASFSRMQADRDEFLDGPKESVQMSEEDYLPHGVIELLNDTRTRANSGINKLRNLEAYDPDLTDDVVDAAKRGRAALAEAGVPTQRGTSTVYQEGVGGISWQSPSYAEHLINSMPDGNEQNFAMNVRQARIVMDVNYEKFVNRLHAFTRKHKNAPTKKQLDAEAEDLRESIFVLNELARLGPDHPVAGRKESFPFHGNRADRSKYAEELHSGLGAAPLVPEGAAGASPGPVEDWLPVGEPLILNMETGLYNGTPLVPGDILMKVGMQQGGWTAEESSRFGALIRVVKVTTDDPATHGNIASGATWSKKDPSMRSGFVTYEQLDRKTGLPEQTFALSLNPQAKEDRSLGHMYDEVYRIESRGAPTEAAPVPTAGSGLVGKSVEDISGAGLFKGTATVIEDGPVIGGKRKVLIEIPGREPFYTDASALKETPATAAPSPAAVPTPVAAADDSQRQVIANKWATAKARNSANAATDLNKLKEAGFDVQDAEDALKEYKDTVRADFDDAESFSEARSEAWDDFVAALDEAESVDAGVPAAAAPTPRVRIAEEAPATGIIGPPKALLDSKPGYRNIREVNFDDPLDKAFYIVAGRDYLSKGDPVFLSWLMDETGLDREQVLREAATIREEMKRFYNENADEMNIPGGMFNEERAGELPAEEAFGPVLGNTVQPGQRVIGRSVTEDKEKFKQGLFSRTTERFSQPFDPARMHGESTTHAWRSMSEAEYSKMAQGNKFGREHIDPIPAGMTWISYWADSPGGAGWGGDLRGAGHLGTKGFTGTGGTPGSPVYLVEVEIPPKLWRDEKLPDGTEPFRTMVPTIEREGTVEDIRAVWKNVGEGWDPHELPVGAKVPPEAAPTEAAPIAATPAPAEFPVSDELITRITSNLQETYGDAVTEDHVRSQIANIISGEKRPDVMGRLAEGMLKQAGIDLGAFSPGAVSPAAALDSYAEKHLQDWLSKTVSEDQRGSVEAGIKRYLQENPDLGDKSWPLLRALADSSGYIPRYVPERVAARSAAVNPPQMLLDSKPRYKIGGGPNLVVQFASPLDKALYIIAGRNYKSKGDPVFLEWAMQVTGKSEDEVIADAQIVKSDIKQFYDPGKVDGQDMYVDEIFNLDEAIERTRQLEELSRMSEPGYYDVGEGGGGGALTPELRAEGEAQLEWIGEHTVTDMAPSQVEAAPGAPPPPSVGPMVREWFTNPGDQGLVYLAIPRDLMLDEVLNTNNRVVNWLLEHTALKQAMKGINPSALADNDAAKLMIAYRAAQVEDDEWIRVVLSAAYDAHAKRFSGKMDLPINRETGQWTHNSHLWDTSKDGPLPLWYDVWSNYKSEKYSKLLEPRHVAIISDYLHVIDDEVERIREYWGLRKRRRKREKGTFFVPRKVDRWYDTANEKWQEFERSSNPNLARMSETATEMFEEHGIRYLSDPRAVLELHLRQALHEIRLDQFGRWTDQLGLSVNISQLMDPQLVAARAGAFGELLRAERTLRNAKKAKIGEGLQDSFGKLMSDNNIRLGISGQTSAAQIETRRARAALRAEQDAAIVRAEEAVEAAKKKWADIKEKYKIRLQQLRSAETVKLSGDGVHLFGGHLTPDKKGEIKVRVKPNLFRNKFFLVDDAKYIDEALGSIDPELKDMNLAGKAGTAFNTIGNTSRFLASFGDFALPFYQLLPLLFRNPVAWVKATANHYHAWIDPTVQARLIRDNLQDYYDLALHGVPVGDPEFFAALVPGQGISVDRLLAKWSRKVTPAPGEEPATAYRVYEMARNAQMAGRRGAQMSVGRFQSSYQVGLGYARVQLLKGIRKGWRGSEAEMYAYIRNMTGGLDSRRLGVGPTQRGFESTWLAFSPRLLRSTMALSQDALRGAFNMGFGDALGVTGRSTAQQRESLRTIASFIGGVFGIYVTTGYAMGKDWEEIEEGLNPMNGRRFLSYEIGGEWRGVGGQIRALMQLSWTMGGLVSGQRGEWKDIISMNMMKNPLVMFYMSRGAPGVMVGGGILEAGAGALGGELDVLPFDDIDGTTDLLSHIGMSSLPFALQSYLESRSVSGALWEFFGGRSTYNPRDKTTNYLTNGEENVYSEQLPMTRWLVNEMTPTGKDDWADIEMNRRKDLINLGYQPDVNYFDWVKIEDRYSGQRGYVAAATDFPEPKLDDPDPTVRGIAQYNSLFRDPAVRTSDGRSTPMSDDNFRVLFAALKYAPTDQEVLPGRFGWGWTPEVERAVMANTNLRPVPWFIVEKIGGARRDSIVASQNAREQIYIEQGRPDLAALSRSVFYMYRPDDPRYANLYESLIEEGPHKFGKDKLDEVYEWNYSPERQKELQESFIR